MTWRDSIKSSSLISRFYVSYNRGICPYSQLTFCSSLFIYFRCVRACVISQEAVASQSWSIDRFSPDLYANFRNLPDGWKRRKRIIYKGKTSRGCILRSSWFSFRVEDSAIRRKKNMWTEDEMIFWNTEETFRLIRAAFLSSSIGVRNLHLPLNDSRRNGNGRQNVTLTYRENIPVRENTTLSCKQDVCRVFVDRRGGDSIEVWEAETFNYVALWIFFFSYFRFNVFFVLLTCL